MTASLLSRLSDNHPFNQENDYHWASKTDEAFLNELKMLLMSRARCPDIEEISLINGSILNYGIDESFSKVYEINSRRQMMEKRIKNAIDRFEPRLKGVELISYINDTQEICFTLHGIYFSKPIELVLAWNDCTGRFYFNE
ncbi:GPW/gp25 family protein [Enterobacter sp. 22466]|uniref:GPW/gp25 family protein n=1 Tax=Enterobacter sp. 22466 TaxID=3453924 RepID=UPI003F854520